MSLRDNILSRINSDLPTKDVEFLGETVRIRALNAGEILDVYGWGMENLVLSDSIVTMVIGATSDPATGEPVFTDADKPVLLGMSSDKAAELTNLVTEIRELTGAETDALEESKKNSEPTPS